MNENQGSQGPKQKIVEKIKNSSNILVTVSKNPNVDELAAALGLTLMLDELSKHPTAVVSGTIPPAISFLDPQKTFESTVNSLRDFIIALDKEKADHLRYKVEGDVVKIFITPYRTTISDLDLTFSQGDYNVELVLALGVDSQDNLDEALSAHGQIFHDATVASLSVGSEKSKLGTVNWHESEASSISEMLVSLSEALKSEKKLLTEQVATAFLTGIVAATDRFSNSKTSSKVMTMAAQLMAAGANQQLIAAHLQENDAISSEPDDEPATVDSADASTVLEDVPSTKSSSVAGTLSISHEKTGDLDEVARQTEAEQQAEAAEQAESSLAEQLKVAAPYQPEKTIQEEIIAESQSADIEPEFGGTLNATAEEAAEAKRREEAGDRNKTILKHGQAGDSGYVGDQSPTFQSTLNASMQEIANEPPSVNVFGGSDNPNDALGRAAPIEAPMPATAVVPEASVPVVQPQAPAVDTPMQPAPASAFETLADIDKKNRADMHATAQADIAAAYAVPGPETQVVPQTSADPIDVLSQVAPLEAPSVPGLPPLPDFAAMPQPDLPPLPQFGPPSGAVHPDQLGQIFGEPVAPPVQDPVVPADPAQFKIPGQG